MFSLVLIALSLIFVEKGKAALEEKRIDIFSAVLSTIGFGGLLLGFSFASNVGFADPATIGSLAVGAIGVIAFLLRQKRASNPLIDLVIFKDSQYRRGFIAIAFLHCSFLGIVLVLPLFYQTLCGGTALESGMLLFPPAFVALIMNPIAGFLANRLGYYKVMIPACIIMFIGAVSFVFVTPSTPFIVLAVMQCVRAVGVSSVIGPLAAWGLETLKGKLIADGSSFSTLIRQISGSIATAIMVLAITTGTLFGDPLMGFRAAFGLSTVMVFLTPIAILAQWAADRR